MKGEMSMASKSYPSSGGYFNKNMLKILDAGAPKTESKKSTKSNPAPKKGKK